MEGAGQPDRERSEADEVEISPRGKDRSGKTVGAVVPQMEGGGDVPQEVEEPHDGGRRQKELSPELYPESCRTETLRWWSKKRNLREGYCWRKHDDNPYPPGRQGHQDSQILPSPPFQRQKRDRRLRQDPDDEGGKGEQKCGRQG